MGEAARVLLAAVLCGALLALGSAGGAAGVAGSEASLVPWVPSESWAGGRQYDPRLERTLEFWGAGMPLREVFAGVKEQTGVEIGFWPPGDMNERVCVTLYLNPEKPPTLRELMAQLSWVTDCAFGVSGEEEEASYYLLATSMAGGALRRLQAEQDAGVKALRARREQLRSESREKLAEKLPEARRGLQLSREELIERYRGVDDLLLLALLDPGRRRLVEFVLGLPQDDQDALLEGQLVRRGWVEWTPRQRLELGAILESTVEYWDPGEYRVQAEQGTLDWAVELPLEVFIEGPSAGSFHVHAGRLSEEEGSPRWGAMSGPHVKLVDGQEPWYPEDTVALREALGEAVTPEDREALYQGWEEGYQARWRAGRQERMRERLEERLAAQRPLTPETEDLLSSLMLPEALEDDRALWQIQEAAAAESGMHVVSDCFWQPRRDLREVVEMLYPERVPEMTGLLAVRLSALSTVKPERILYSYANNDRAGWEWEDAGEFLRFRHAARDLWRAALLPEAVLGEMDEWLEPYVTEAVESERDETTIAVSLGIRQASRVARQLDDFQLYHGAKVIYRDPADAEEAYRQRLREEVLETISRWAGLYRLFGTFTEQQWEGLCGPGLRWSADLTTDQQAMEVSSYLAPVREQLPDVTIKLTEGGPMYGRGRNVIPNVRNTYTLGFSLDGEPPSRRGSLGPAEPQPRARFARELSLPRTILVHLRRPERLVDLTLAGE